MLSSGIQPGEQLMIQFGGNKRTFTVNGYFKDAFMGGLICWA
ncbi:hypothetical protein ACFTAO_20955 [Paenibacillus rhizoplanae]